MKNTELKEQRDLALFDAYRHALETTNFRYQQDAVNWVRTHAAPKFYVSPAVCAKFMSEMMKGKHLEGINALAKKKFIELFRRFMNRIADTPSASIISICEQIVEEPAPEFYIGYDIARKAISKGLKLQREKMTSKFICRE